MTESLDDQRKAELEAQKVRFEEVRRLGEAARDLLKDPAFGAAVLQLRKQWFAELMGAPPRQDDLVSKLRALEEIPSVLNSFVKSHEIMAKRQK